ncbi:hypothetical protein DFH06DRAFT_509690 [Mycena polygramma]|nr:hypothetical protein DFH06DRAFT_509690 [Mycena polygramma]
MFSDSHHFTVAGGTFTSVISNYTGAPTVPSAIDLQVIPLGDVDLLREIRLDNSTAFKLDRQRAHLRVRRVYSARVGDRPSNVTVAMYQGHNAKEAWQEDIARYMSVRHPYIIQIRGKASWGNIHAALFHDELIPLTDLLALHRQSHFSTVNIYACCHRDFDEVRDYVYSVLRQPLGQSTCTIWIRQSTGRLCVDLVQSSDTPSFYSYDLPDELPRVRGMFSLNGSTTEATVIDSLTLEEYQAICFSNLSQCETITLSTSMLMYLGAVYSYPLQEMIASLRTVELCPCCWETRREAPEEIIADGWTRFDYHDMADNAVELHICDISIPGATWLSQANHIFNRLRIKSNLEGYVLMNGIYFEVEISAATKHPRAGFLFLCPKEHFQVGPSTFCWPACPAYWSLDPSGANRLSTDEAMTLGLPAINLSTTVQLYAWDAAVYTGIRRFHEAKGFDPDSQDAARHLGHPLYQLSGEIDGPFAHVLPVDDQDANAEEEDDPVPMDLSW